eukprot:gene3330-5620_t
MPPFGPGFGDRWYRFLMVGYRQAAAMSAAIPGGWANWALFAYRVSAVWLEWPSTDDEGGEEPGEDTTDGAPLH